MSGHIFPQLATDIDVIRSFPEYKGPGHPGFLTNFLGVKTATKIHCFIGSKGGTVEGYPIPANFHGSATEWGGTLRSVVEAKDKFVAVELGAGWGPWLVSAAAAAKQLGINDIYLVGVEGSRKHHRYMREHFADNGFDPDEHDVRHGVVGTYDGIASFPDLEDAEHWGVEAGFVPPDSHPNPVPAPAPAPARRSLLYRALRRAKRTITGRAPTAAPTPSVVPVTVVPVIPPHLQVPCYSLTGLLKPLKRVDLLHIDIQGSEFDVVASARTIIQQKVRRMVIGTHGRMIEEQLMRELSSQGWIIETDDACYLQQQATTMQLHTDGCQVWSNPRLETGNNALNRNLAA